MPFSRQGPTPGEKKKYHCWSCFETELLAVLFELDPTGSRAKKIDARGFARAHKTQPEPRAGVEGRWRMGRDSRRDSGGRSRMCFRCFAGDIPRSEIQVEIRTQEHNLALSAVRPRIRGEGVDDNSRSRIAIACDSKICRSTRPRCSYLPAARRGGRPREGGWPRGAPPPLLSARAAPRRVGRRAPPPAPPRGGARQRPATGR